MLNVPGNNFSVMSGLSHRFLGIISTFRGVNVSLLKDTTRRRYWTLEMESNLNILHFFCKYLQIYETRTKFDAKQLKLVCFFNASRIMIFFFIPKTGLWLLVSYYFLAKFYESASK